MGNPILEMLNGQNTKNSSNAGPLPTNMDDPRMNSAKNYVAKHGGNAKAAFYQLCRERMLNPAEVINQILGNRR